MNITRFHSLEIKLLISFTFVWACLSGLSEESCTSSHQSGNDNNVEKGQRSVLSSSLLNKSSINNDSTSISAKLPTTGVSPVQDSDFSNSLSTLTSDSLSADRTISKNVQPSNSVGGSEASNVSSNRSDLSMNIPDEGLVHDSLDFEQFFQEGYCKPSPLSDCRDTTEVVTDVDSSSSPGDREKSEEDGDNDDMLGGVFAFSEEGRHSNNLVLFHHNVYMSFNIATRNHSWF